jgi:general secretion pathway protein A
MSAPAAVAAPVTPTSAAAAPPSAAADAALAAANAAAPAPSPALAAANAAAPVASSALAVSAAAPDKRTLLAMLDARTRDRDAAFSSLFALWGEDYSARRAEAGCEYARRVGLRCLGKTGTWSVLRRLDLPVVLTLRPSAGEAHYATLTALADDAATLDLAGTTATFGLADIERVWDGAFVALWRTNGLATTGLRPGMTGRDVLWLRQQLAITGGGDRTLYDDEVRERVVAFQREHGLTPDGIAGDETLARIAAMAPDARMPSLSKARP